MWVLGLLGLDPHGAGICEIPVIWRDVPGSTFSVTRHAAGCLRDLARIQATARRSVAVPAIVPVADELRAG